MAGSSGFVVWLTGLPASGKSTIAGRLHRHLRQRGFKVELLDGNDVRKWFLPTKGYSKPEWERRLRSVAHICRLLSRNGVIVIASFVSPYRSARGYARRLIGDFVEVYVRCPLEVVKKRDTKGLYKKALQNRRMKMIGVQEPYEEPLHPEIIVDTDRNGPGECVDLIIEKLIDAKLIQSKTRRRSVKIVDER